MLQHFLNSSVYVEEWHEFSLDTAPCTLQHLSVPLLAVWLLGLQRWAPALSPVSEPAGPCGVPEGSAQLSRGLFHDRALETTALC